MKSMQETVMERVGTAVAFVLFFGAEQSELVALHGEAVERLSSAPLYRAWAMEPAPVQRAMRRLR